MTSEIRVQKDAVRNGLIDKADKETLARSQNTELTINDMVIGRRISTQEIPCSIIEKHITP